MFVKKDGSYNDREVRAFLEYGSEFEGKLTFSGIVRLNGKLRGDISTDDTLIVGEHALIEGNVEVGTLILGGKISGEVTATNHVEIQSTGQVEGILNSPVLVTHEGAQIKASVNVIKTAATKTLQPAGN